MVEIVSVLVTAILLAALCTDRDWWLAFTLLGSVVLVALGFALWAALSTTDRRF